MHNDKGKEFQTRGAQLLKARDPATIITLGSTSKVQAGEYYLR